MACPTTCSGIADVSPLTVKTHPPILHKEMQTLCGWIPMACNRGRYMHRERHNGRRNL